MNRVALLALIALIPAAAGGQSVAENLARGEQAYAALNVEPAKVAFMAVINAKQLVTTADKVKAYKYLGGYWALSGKPDSASSYFIAALDFDPFTDLDPRVFTSPDEQNAFTKAKLNIFKIGILPIGWFALDPNASDAKAHAYTFKIVSTHAARADVLLYNATDSTKQGSEVIASIPRLDGTRDLPWSGTINNVRAEPGIYELAVIATEQATGQTKLIERQKFRIDQVHAPFEDSLPAFTDKDTLTSRYPGAAPILDGVKGAVIAGLAAALPLVALQERGRMANANTHAYLGLGLGLSAGGIAAWFGATHRDNTAATAENTRRKAERIRFNAEVKARNDARRSRTILVIHPLTGTGG